MTIDDLLPGRVCTILVAVKGMKTEIPTVVRKHKGKHSIIVDAFKKDDKVISLSKALCHLLVEVPEGQPELFKYVVPETTYDRKDHVTYYEISLKDKESVTVNRRGAYRLFIGELITVRADENRKTFEVNLKDVSSTGFAIVFKKADLPQGYHDIKRFHFVYNDFEPEVGFSATLSLTGDVRRIIELEDGKMLFGCSFPKSAMVEKYIADKERLKTKKRMGI